MEGSQTLTTTSGVQFEVRMSYCYSHLSIYQHLTIKTCATFTVCLCNFMFVNWPMQLTTYVLFVYYCLWFSQDMKSPRHMPNGGRDLADSGWVSTVDRPLRVWMVLVTILVGLFGSAGYYLVERFRLPYRSQPCVKLFWPKNFVEFKACTQVWLQPQLQKCLRHLNYFAQCTWL